MLLFKKILDFQKPEGGWRDKRGAKRYPVGAKFALKAKLGLQPRDGEGNALPPGKGAPMDWGCQLVNLSSTGINVRLHPAAVASPGEVCALKLELDNKLFEIDAKVAHFRATAQFVVCGLVLQFADSYSRKAYLQIMEPVVIGSTFEAVPAAKVKQDLPGLLKEQYVGESQGESEGVLSIWRDSSGKHPKLFELLFHDFSIRGNTEMPGLKITYREGAKIGRRVSRPAFPLPVPPGLKVEVRQLFQLIVPNLPRAVPAEVRKFLDLFTVEPE